MHGLVRLGGQALEEVGEIGGGVDAGPVAVADQGVERGGACAALGIAHEQPVFLADGAGSDGVLDEVVVDLHAAIAQEHAQLRPLVEGVADGLSR